MLDIRSIHSSVAIVLLLTLSACGGGGSESSSFSTQNERDTETVKTAEEEVSQPPIQEGNAPSVSLQADVTSVFAGDSVTLSWTANNVDQCSASGDWNGRRDPSSGSETIFNLSADSVFEISCSGENGDVNDIAQVTVTETSVVLPPQPELMLAASLSQVEYLGSTTLSWSATNADSCEASGDWSGNKPVSGSQTITAMTDDASFTLSCSGTGGSVTNMAQVVVVEANVEVPEPEITLSTSLSQVEYLGSTTLSWSATNADSCEASGDWTGNKSVTGSQLVSDMTTDSTFTLTCTGEGGTSTVSAPVTVAAQIEQPTVTFWADASNIEYGQGTTLNWTSEHADSCVAYDDWSGAKATSGSLAVNDLVADQQYTLTCSGAGGTAEETITVAVAPAPTPSIEFSASPTTVSSGGSTTLNWSSSDATSCSATGDWNGNKSLSGAETLDSITSDSQFTISCTGPGGTTNQSVNIAVVVSNNGTALLSWTPPIENSDGSPLLDLAGYKVYYGTEPGVYTETVELNEPGISSYLVENLASATWYFAVTAYNGQSIESALSSEVSKTIN